MIADHGNWGERTASICGSLNSEIPYCALEATLWSSILTRILNDDIA